jgi:hypothetical protein
LPQGESWKQLDASLRHGWRGLTGGSSLSRLLRASPSCERTMSEPLLDQFDGLNVWSRGDQRAPHKPLLMLFALGRWCRGEQGAVAFRDAEGTLTELLKRFGPPRQS